MLFAKIILISVIGLILNLFYILVAKKNLIFANIKSRSLHKDISVTGAGIVFASIFLLMFVLSGVSNKFSITISISCFLIIFLGFYDDIKGIKPLFKLLAQLIVSIAIIYNYEYLLKYNFIIIFIIFVTLVWYFNLFNFIDGINGFASLNFILPLGCLFLFNEYLSNFNILTLEILFPLILIFLFFNLKGKYFMGETGSFFLSLILLLNIYDQVNLNKDWMIIIILFNYPIIDTGITLINRILKSKYWYKEHRGHAYQNYSRLYGHSKMVFIYLSYYILFILPITFIYKNNNNFDYYLTFISILPAVIFCIKFGVNMAEKKFFYEE